MFHFFGRTNTDRGDSLTGWQIELIDRATGAVVPIFSDENSTPIVTVSGVANRALSDDQGNYDFFVSDGTYDRRIYNKDGVFQRVDEYLPSYGSGYAGAEADRAEAARAGAETAETGSAAAKTGAEAAEATTEGYRDETETARDTTLGYRNEAQVAASGAIAAGRIVGTTAAGVAAYPNDGDGWWLQNSDDTLDFYTTQTSAAQNEGFSLIGQGELEALIGDLSSYTGFPSARNKYGAVLSIHPAGMAASEATLDANGVYTITAGAGNDLRYSTTTSVALTPGDNFICYVEPKDANFDGATSTITVGTSQSFTQVGDYWVYEGVVPASTTSFSIDLNTNGSASSGVVRWGFGPPSATGLYPQGITSSLANFFANDGAADAANLWSAAPLAVSAGDGIEDERASGLALAPGEYAYGLLHCYDSSGNPAFFDRAWLEAQTGGFGNGNFFAAPIADQPGWSLVVMYLDPAIYTQSTIYIDLNVDNLYTVDVADEVDITVAVQLYRNELPSFAAASSGGSSGAIITNTEPGILLKPTTTRKGIFMPGGKPGSNRGISINLDYISGLNDGAGGTTSNCWNIKHIYDARRTATDDFTTVTQITDDNGQEGFATFLSSDSSEIVGFEGHGRCTSTADPQIWADGTLLTHSDTDAVRASKLDIVTRHTITNYAGSADIMELVTLYRFDAFKRQMEQFWWIKALSDFSTYATYVGMLSPKLTTVDEVYLPERGFSNPVSTSGGNAADLDARLVSLCGDAGFQFDFEILEAPSTAEMWTQATGSNLKIYPTLTQLANTNRQGVAPPATNLTTGDTLFMRAAVTLNNGN